MNDNHKIALNEALAWVSVNFKPVGIIVTGSIVRGNPDLNSDFDIFVIHEDSFRQRIQKLIQTAQEFLLKTPSMTGNKITRLKYAISTLFEDATDVMDKDTVTSTSSPRPKERIKYLEANHPDIGNLVAGYYGAENFRDRYAIAKTLVAKTTGESGFFEWDSGQE